MLRNSLIAGLLIVAASGCRTVRRAHEAQDSARASVESTAVRSSVPAESTLGELVDFAFANRPSVLSAQLAVADARLRLREIAAGAPVVSDTPWNAIGISAGGGYSESGVGEHFSDFDMTTKRGKATGALSVDLLLYDFGRNAAEARAQVERVIAAESALLETEREVFHDVVVGVASLREALALRQVAETNLASAVGHLEQSEQREVAGEAKRLDVLAAKLTFAQAVESLVAASNEVVTTQANLTQALGAASVGAGREIIPSRGGLVPVAADGIFLLAETNAPAMRIARARARAASFDVDRAIADLYPTLSASASLSWTDPLWYFRWGFDAAQSLFTGFRKTTAVDRAVVALQAAVATVNESSLTLRRSLDLALAARENAREMRRTAVDTLRAAEENFALVSEQYRIGEASRVDFADALKSVTDARGSEAKAESAALRAEAAIYATVGLAPEYL